MGKQLRAVFIAVCRHVCRQASILRQLSAAAQIVVKACHSLVVFLIEAAGIAGTNDFVFVQTQLLHSNGFYEPGRCQIQLMRPVKRISVDVLFCDLYGQPPGGKTPLHCLYAANTVPKIEVLHILQTARDIYFNMFGGKNACAVDHILGCRCLRPIRLITQSPHLCNGLLIAAQPIGRNVRTVLVDIDKQVLGISPEILAVISCYKCPHMVSVKFGIALYNSFQFLFFRFLSGLFFRLQCQALQFSLGKLLRCCSILLLGALGLFGRPLVRNDSHLLQHSLYHRFQLHRVSPPACLISM